MSVRKHLEREHLRRMREKLKQAPATEDAPPPTPNDVYAPLPSWDRRYQNFGKTAMTAKPLPPTGTGDIGAEKTVPSTGAMAPASRTRKEVRFVDVQTGRSARTTKNSILSLSLSETDYLRIQHHLSVTLGLGPGNRSAWIREVLIAHIDQIEEQIEQGNYVSPAELKRQNEERAKRSR